MFSLIWRRLALALLGVAVPGLGLACACGCGVFDVGTSAMYATHAGGMAFLEYDYMDQSHNRQGTSNAPAADNADKAIRTSFLTLGGQYFFNESWGVSVEVPYWHRYFQTEDPDTLASVDFTHSAVGDIRIKGIYTGLADDMSTTDFVPSGGTIGYTYSAMLYNGYTSTSKTTITPGKYGTPTPDNVYLNDGQGRRVLIKGAAAPFSLYATITSTDPNISPMVSDDGLSLYDIRYVINNMGLSNNVINISNGGSGYNVSTTTVTCSASDTGAQATLGFTANAGVITGIYVNTPGSGYLTTPTITITDANSAPGTGATAVIHGETSSSGGNGYARYFTKKVVMTPGNDSGDLRVFYTAYKPAGTNVYVYYKILSASDSTPFDSTNWQLMTQINGINNYSTSRDNLIEYECAPGVNNVANNYISYTNVNGQKYSTFIQFAIKVVLATSDNTNVPFLTDIRALALPQGTGI